MVLPQGGCVDPARSNRAATDGLVAPFRPEFEADVREAGDRGHQAMNRSAEKRCGAQR
jgi:hypothetical protein